MSDETEIKTDDVPDAGKRSGLVGIREELSNTYIATIVAAVVVAATLTAGVVVFVMNNRADNRIGEIQTDHKSEMVDLKRQHYEKLDTLLTQLDAQKRLAGSDDILHIRDNILVDPNEEHRIPKFAKEYDNGSFYAMGDKGAFIRDSVYLYDIVALIKRRRIDQEIVLALREGGDLQQVHFWRSNEEIDIQNHPFFETLFPHFVIEKFRYGTFTQVTGYDRENPSLTALDFKQLRELRDRAESGEGVEEYLQTLNDKLFRGDPTGYVLISALWAKIQFANFNKSPILIRTINKQPGFVYVHTITTLEDVIVNMHPRDRMYIHEELYVVYTRSGIYVVRSFLPSAETVIQRSKNWNIMKMWWAAFRIKSY